MSCPKLVDRDDSTSECKAAARDFDSAKQRLIGSFVRLIESGTDFGDLREEIVGITNPLTCLLELSQARWAATDALSAEIGGPVAKASG